MTLHIIKKVQYNLLCDKYTLQLEKINIIEKLKYIKNKYVGIIKRKKKIKFMGKRYYYDNLFGSALFQLSPIEIEKINKKLNLKKIKSILDIGANTGQWTFSLKLYFPHIKVYSFEPIKMAFECLQKNSKQFDDWKVYNYAIGNIEGKKNFYYSPKRTTTGSFYKNIVEYNFKRKDIQNTRVDVMKIRKNNKLKIPLYYDFIKIDVEGFEKEVLKSLKDVKFKYIYIEIHKGKGNFNQAIKEVLAILKNQGKQCKIIYKNYLEISSQVVEVIMYNSEIN